MVPLQGHLADADGVAINGSVQVRMALYANLNATDPLWEDVLEVDARRGAFAVSLGAGSVPLDLELFAVYPAAHLELQVEGDSPMPRVPLEHVPYAAWANQSGDAQTLGGVGLAELREEIPTIPEVQQAARQVSFDTEAELTAALDAYYDYQAGAGISIVDNAISVEDGYVEAVCIDAVEGLTGAFDDQYVARTDGIATALTVDGSLSVRAPARIAWDEDVAVGGRTGSLVVGESANIGIDGNEIMARDADGNPSTLFLNANGGGVRAAMVVQTDGVQGYATHQVDRFHMTLNNSASGGRTRPIPQDVMNNLCGDADGCEVRLGMTRYSSGAETEAASRGPYLFYYTPANGRWRLSNDVSGDDGDGVTRHAINIWNTCYFTDSTYEGYVDRGDSAQGMSLLLWNGYAGANRTCELTLID